MDKNETRKIVKQKRDALSADVVLSKSAIIQNKFLELITKYTYKNIFIYKSFKNEVSTEEIISSLENSKNIYLPRIVGSNMIAVQYNKETLLEGNIFGIYEPIGTDVHLNDFICVLPLIAVDKQGNRIGFGKGFYDRFLEGKNCLKIGLCYDFQILKSISHESYDIPLNIIISEKRTIYITK